MTEVELKTSLTAIKERDYSLREGDDLDQLLGAMVDHVGSLDPDLRDGLIYTCFYKWIEVKRLLSKDQMKKLFSRALDQDKLFYKVGTDDQESVYTRTFSVLILNPILCVHEEEAFLDRDQVDRFRQAMFDYIRKEEDFRGYHSDYGWAHALAHWSDSTYFMTYGLDDPKPVALDLLQVIQDKYLGIKIPLSREEEERLTTNIVYTFLDEGIIDLADFKAWLNGFSKAKTIEDKMHKYTAQVNIKNFIRALYFRMVHLKQEEAFIQAVLDLEKDFCNFYY